jgi:uncharacterized protein with PhoU and TrkA domain
MFIGRHLLPVRQSPGEEPTTQHLYDYISEVRVLEEGRLAGKTLFESRLGADYDLTVIALVRDEVIRTGLDRDTHINPNDLILLEGPLESLKQHLAYFETVIDKLPPKQFMKFS